MAQPTSASTRRNSASDKLTLNPGMASSLSSVPPVWPRPRPLIIGTRRPESQQSKPRGKEFGGARAFKSFAALKYNQRLRPEFKDYLAARAAGRAGHTGCVGHCNGTDSQGAFSGYGCEDCITLGADRQ